MPQSIRDGVHVADSKLGELVPESRRWYKGFVTPSSLAVRETFRSSFGEIWAAFCKSMGRVSTPSMFGVAMPYVCPTIQYSTRANSGGHSYFSGLCLFVNKGE